MKIIENMKPTNCEVVSREFKDEYDEKTKKHIREITIVKRCVLKKLTNENLVLNRQTLNRMIDEEIDLFLKKNGKRLNKRQRQDALGIAPDEFKKLSVGIIEEEDLEEDCESETPGGRWHSRDDGEFVAADRAGSWSLQKACGKVNRASGGKRGASSAPCGRFSKTTSPRKKCSD